MEKIQEEVGKQLLYVLLKIRRFEEKLVELYPAQEIKTPVHLSIGQEAVAAGVCAHLQKEDLIFSNHRNHGHCIAKGINIKYLMAELYGRATGCSGGRGGSMHPAEPECGILGTSAIVGGSIPLAVGAALASRMKRDGKVTVAFFGDGAVDQGVFHESMNFAALKKLPVVFICENNFYATNSHQSARQPHDNIAKRGESYEVAGVQVDGNNVLDVYKVAGDAVKRAIDGAGPALIECRTYRWKGHVGPDCDYQKGCRSKDELEAWIERCPLNIHKEYLIKNNVVTESDIEKMEKEIDTEIESAVQFAKDSPFPDKEELGKYVYFIGAYNAVD